VGYVHALSSDLHAVVVASLTGGWGTTSRPMPAPRKPEKIRPINDGRLLERTRRFIRMTGGRGKPITYGTGKFPDPPDPKKPKKP
jgi:hypothetical protein